MPSHLLTVFRQLDESERIQIADLLTETQTDTRLSRLIEELANTPPAAIDGHADAIVSGDGDLRADDTLRSEMEAYGVKIWGIKKLLEAA